MGEGWRGGGVGFWWAGDVGDFGTRGGVGIGISGKEVWDRDFGGLNCLEVLRITSC